MLQGKPVLDDARDAHRYQRKAGDWRAYGCAGYDASGSSVSPHGGRVARIRLVAPAPPPAAGAAAPPVAAAAPAAAPPATPAAAGAASAVPLAVAPPPSGAGVNPQPLAPVPPPVGGVIGGGPKPNECVPYAVNLYVPSAANAAVPVTPSGAATPSASSFHGAGTASRASATAAAAATTSPSNSAHPDRPPEWYVAAAVQMVETVRAELTAASDVTIAKAEQALAAAETAAADRKDDATRAAAVEARKKLNVARQRSSHAFNRFLPLILIPFRAEYFGGTAHAGVVLPALIEALQRAAGRSAPAPAAAPAAAAGAAAIPAASGAAPPPSASSAAAAAASASSASSASSSSAVGGLEVDAKTGRYPLAVDIALVFTTAPEFHAAQFARKHVDSRGAGWGILGATQSDASRVRLFGEAHRLAKLIIKKQLVYFVGAGLSMGAGLPDWKALIDTLAAEARMSGAEQKALNSFPFLDGARVIANRLRSQGRSLGEVVAQAVHSEWYTVAHSLLAGSGPRIDTITTNYDRLIEMARRAAGVTIPVIPAQHGTDATDTGGCWLLKMHGCVTRPQEIVLSRDHYLEYDSSRSALAGIAQTKLLTKHICFFGFSLSDDNFFKIISAVRGATNQRKRQLGTCLMLFTNEMFEELWKTDVNVVRIDDGTAMTTASANPFGFAGRQLEIMLDLMSSHTASTAHFLFDSRYQLLLPPVDAALCQLWDKFFSALPKQIEANWQIFADFRKRSGALFAGGSGSSGTGTAAASKKVSRDITRRGSFSQHSMLPRAASAPDDTKGVAVAAASGVAAAPSTPQHQMDSKHRSTATIGSATPSAWQQYVDAEHRSPASVAAGQAVAKATASLRVSIADPTAADAPPPPPALQRRISSMNETELSAHATRLQQMLRNALLAKRRQQHIRLQVSNAATALASPKRATALDAVDDDEDDGGGSDADVHADGADTAQQPDADSALTSASGGYASATAPGAAPGGDSDSDDAADAAGDGGADDDGTAATASAAAPTARAVPGAGAAVSGQPGKAGGKPQYKSKREKQEIQRMKHQAQKELNRKALGLQKRGHRSAMSFNTVDGSAPPNLSKPGKAKGKGADATADGAAGGGFAPYGAVSRPLSAPVVARNRGDNHLFVLHTDIRRLACDAWLLPAGGIVDPPRYWFYPELDTKPSVRSEYTLPIPFELSEYLAREFPDRLVMPDVRRVGSMLNYHADRARPVTTASSGSLTQALDGVAKWIMFCHQTFIAGDKFVPPRFGRERHLFALPVVGTGRGRLRDSTGTVVQHIVKFLRKALKYAEFDFDVALVCRDEPTYLCAQQARYAMYSENLDRVLPSAEAREQAHALALDAVRGKLALFVGPQSGFLPSEHEKLVRLATELGFSESELDELRRPHVNRFDGYQLIANRMQTAALAAAAAVPAPSAAMSAAIADAKQAGDNAWGERKLLKAVSQMLATDEIAMTNVLCASMPTQEVITLQPDTNFESASDDADQSVCVLPYGMEHLKETDRWLLKLNGCVTRPNTLVLTRAQHSAAAPVRAVNGSIIEAQLVTRHLLMVNVPMEDGYFRNALNAVQSIVRSTATNRDWQADPIATVITPERCELLQQTWPQLRVVTPTTWPQLRAEHVPPRIVSKAQAAAAAEPPAAVAAAAPPTDTKPARSRTPTKAKSNAATAAARTPAPAAATPVKADAKSAAPPAAGDSKTPAAADAKDPTAVDPLDAVSGEVSPHQPTAESRVRRAVDRFLDYVNCVIATVNDKPLLDWRFENILSEDERLVQRELRALVLELPSDATASSAFWSTRLLLRRLGVDDYVLATVLKRAEEFGSGASRTVYYHEMVKGAFSRPINKPRKSNAEDEPLFGVGVEQSAKAFTRKGEGAGGGKGRAAQPQFPTNTKGAIYPRQDYRQKPLDHAARNATASAISNSLVAQQGLNVPDAKAESAAAKAVRALAAAGQPTPAASATAAASGAAATGDGTASGSGAGAVVDTGAGGAAAAQNDIVRGAGLGTGGFGKQKKNKNKSKNAAAAAAADAKAAERAKYRSLLG